MSSLAWKNNLLSILFFSPICVCSCSTDKNENRNPGTPVVYEAQVTIQTDEGQMIRRFGCASAFAPPNTTPMTNEEIARLFGNGNGQVGLNLFRIKVGTDDAWRTIELNYAKEAMKHGARILASPWSPPARMKTTNNIVKGKLIPDSAAAYAKYLNDFAMYMEAKNWPTFIEWAKRYI